MILTLIAALALQAEARTIVPPPPACLPLQLRNWPTGHPLGHGFTIGHAFDLPTMEAATVRLAVQPSKPLTGSHVATVGFEVYAPGRYLVAAGGTKAKIQPLWLDIAGADGKPLKSVGHRHGPACSSVTKIVEFDLKPGKYTFLATGLTAADPVRVLVARAGATSLH